MTNDAGTAADGGPQRVRLLFSHNYSMSAARAGWAAGRYPGHHLLGTTALSADVEVVDLPYGEVDPGGRAWWIRQRFGNLGQQWRILRTASRGARVVLYSGEYRTLSTLLLLRRWRMLRRPIIVVAHDAPAGRVDAAALRGADVILCNNAEVARALGRLRIPAERVQIVSWGPDLDFPGYRSTGSDYVLSVGKSSRDLPTLLAALERTGLPARVYAGPEEPHRWAARLPNVEFRESQPGDPSDPGLLTYDHVLDDLQRAAVFAVPLRGGHRPFGLTELADALALGKPIVMTRNPHIDCDLEAIGCGVWVEEGDVDAWADTLERLMAAPEVREQMGRAGRAFAEREWNQNGFDVALRRAVDSVTGREPVRLDDPGLSEGSP